MRYEHRKANRRKKQNHSVYIEPTGWVWRRGGPGGVITAFTGYPPEDFPRDILKGFMGLWANRRRTLKVLSPKKN